VSTSKEPTPAEAALRPPKRRPFGVMIVQSEPRRRAKLATLLQDEDRLLYEASGIPDAQRILKSYPIDLVVSDTQLRGGCGLMLTERLKRRGIGTILTCRKPQLAEAVAAVRSGALDLLPEPVDAAMLSSRVDEALDDVAARSGRARRRRQLKRLVRRLSQDRRAARRQVDQLCGDLVEAYHRLAERVDHHRELDALREKIDERLAIEPLLRSILDFILDRLGATNAVIFLPARDGRYTAGAYVNASFSPDAVRPMLEDLADQLAPQAAELEGPRHFAGPDALRSWLGHGDADWLEESQVILAPCRKEDENLAILMIFREVEEPLSAQAMELAEAVAPFLAERLHTLLCVHHRLSGLMDEEDADTDSFPPPKRF
jgi:DNA-binding response OmpR family regulator